MPVKTVLDGSSTPVRIWTDDIDEGSKAQLANIASLPFIHRASKLLRVPTPPYEPLGIVHLAGATIKTRSFAVDGGTTTLRYRDLLRFFGDQAAI